MSDDVLMLSPRTTPIPPRDDDPFHLLSARKMSMAGLEEKLADFYHRQNELIDSFLAVPGQVRERASEKKLC